MGRLLLLSTLAVAGLVTLYPFGLTPWRLVYEVVPGAQAIRAPARAGVFLLFPLSIGVAAVVAGVEREGKTLVAAALVALCVAEQLRFVPSYDKLEARHFVERIAQRVPRECTAFYFAVIPPEQEGASLPHRPWKYHLDAMWAGLDAGVPAVNGYSGFLPRGWQPLYDNVLRAPEDHARLDVALADWMGRHGAGTACRVDVGFE